MPLKNRIYYFDYLRFFAAFAVITSHVADEFVYYPWTLEQSMPYLSSFNIGNMFDSLSRFAVHIFFFISGAIFLDPTSNFRFSKHFTKLVFALVFYSTFYPIVVRYLQAQGIQVNIQKLEQMLKMTTFENREEFFATTFHHFLRMPIVFHLWFLYRMLSNYLAIPFLRIVTSNTDSVKKKNAIEYTLLIWIIFGIILPTLAYFYPNFIIRVRADFMPSYLGPLLLGYYLHHYPIKINTFFLILIWVISNYAMWYGVHFENLKQLPLPKGEHFNVWSYDNTRIFVILNAGSIFLLAKRYLNRAGLLFNIFIKPFSLASFQVYLIHILVLSFVLNMWTNPKYFAKDASYFINNPWSTIPITSIITLVASFIIAYTIITTINIITYPFKTSTKGENT